MTAAAVRLKERVLPTYRGLYDIPGTGPFPVRARERRWGAGMVLYLGIGDRDVPVWERDVVRITRADEVIETVSAIGPSLWTALQLARALDMHDRVARRLLLRMRERHQLATEFSDRRWFYGAKR